MLLISIEESMCYFVVPFLRRSIRSFVLRKVPMYVRYLPESRQLVILEDTTTCDRGSHLLIYSV